MAKRAEPVWQGVFRTRRVIKYQYKKFRACRWQTALKKAREYARERNLVLERLECVKIYYYERKRKSY